MRACKNCHKLFEPKANNSRYCSLSCRYEAQIKRNRISRQKKKATATTKTLPWKYCNRTDCLYYNDSWNYLNKCDYLWLTGKLRGCGRGEDCTKYIQATREARKKYRNSVIREDEEGRNKAIF